MKMEKEHREKQLERAKSFIAGAADMDSCFYQEHNPTRGFGEWVIRVRHLPELLVRHVERVVMEDPLNSIFGLTIEEVKRRLSEWDEFDQRRAGRTIGLWTQPRRWVMTHSACET